MGELKKSLGFGGIIALTITAMVGTGMFFGTSAGAKYSGNAVLIAWIILIAISTYVAACFGELTALFPTAGGVYEFSKQAYGVFISFIIGWITWIMSTVAITVLIIAALEYVLPPGASPYLRIGFAVGLILLLNFVAFMGVDISGAVLIFFAIESIFLFMSIIIPGLSHIQPANFSPFFTKPAHFILVAVFFMVEALMGWEAASFLAEETKNPGRVIPKALIITTLIAGLLGLGIAIVSLGVIPWYTLSDLSAPVTNVAFIVLGEAGSRFVAWGIVLALLGSVTGTVISTPRLLLAMARDRVLPSQLAKIHPVTKTPHIAIFFQTFVSIALILVTFGQYDFLLSLFTPISLIMYSAVLMVVPILRKKLPHIVREFKAPFGTVGPVIVSLFYLFVILAWIVLTPDAYSIFKIAVSLILVGMPIYLMMIFFYNPDAVSSFMNTFTRVNLLFENAFLPKSIRSEMLLQSKELYEKKVLEYGSGVGTLTIQIASAVGPRGEVYATDMSKGNINLLRSRLDKLGIKNVHAIHDEHHSSRIHPDIKSVDAIFSVGVLSYMQGIDKILSEMNRILPDSGQICFVEYVNFFKILPDKEWLSDSEVLKERFRKAGFAVNVHVKKGLLWNYLFIIGVKSDENVPFI